MRQRKKVSDNLFSLLRFLLRGAKVIPPFLFLLLPESNPGEAGLDGGGGREAKRLFLCHWRLRRPEKERGKKVPKTTPVGKSR